MLRFWLSRAGWQGQAVSAYEVDAGEHAAIERKVGRMNPSERHHIHCIILNAIKMNSHKAIIMHKILIIQIA